MFSPDYLKLFVFISCVCRAEGIALAFYGECYAHTATDTEAGKAALRIASYHFM
jgi:hypothetical protein